MISRFVFKFSAISLLAVAFASCEGTEPCAAESVMSEIDNPGGKVLVIAHRGDWRNAPENSIRAYSNALEMGAQILELDVRESSDGVLINMHDATLDRTTTGKGLIREHTASEILDLNLKDGHNYPTVHHPCTIEQVLETFRGRCVFEIDKADGHYEKLYRLAVKTGTVDQILLKTYLMPSALDPVSREVIKKVRFVPCLSLDADKCIPMIDEYIKMGACGFELTFSKETDEILAAIRNVRDNHLFFAATTLLDKWCGGRGDDRAVENDEEEECWGTLYKQGANIFMTDRPEQMIAFFRKKGVLFK